MTLIELVDIGNGCFESIGAWFTWRNAWQLYKDKRVSGVYWPTTLFFTCWGVWNLLYYPILQQWISFVGGIFLVMGNVVWVTLYLKYRKINKMGTSFQ